MAGSVYDDYKQRRFAAYFTPGFLHKHLRPHCPVPLGGFDANRSRARHGNVSLVERNQHFRAVSENSLIFDFDAQRRVFQILLLMQEAARNNSDGSFALDPDGVFYTEQEYAYLTTQPGSRHTFARAVLPYNVQGGGGRFVICHVEWALIE